jgi:poly-gamma-glutamate synthesis protein (capsule biosynthesis protein)
MRLLLVGDVMLGRLVNQVLKDVGPEYPWGDTLPLFSSADLRLCNLECVLSDRGRPWSATPKVFRFRSDASNVDVLTSAGIELVSLANNHVLDYDYVALLDMLAIFEETGIRHAGAGRDRAEARRPAVIQCAGLRVGMIAFTDNEPAWEATDERPGTFYVPIDLHDHRAGQLFGLISDASSAVDLVVVSAHWGPNWGYRPPPEHIAFGRALVDAGADIVFGHSPHVLRGVELYRGKPIVYNAGDFIDDYTVDEIERNDESFVFVLDTDRHAVREISLYPTLIRNMQARRAGHDRAPIIAGKMQALCREFGTDVQWYAADDSLRIPVRQPARHAS